jgi:hypothetical protein
MIKPKHISCAIAAVFFLITNGFAQDVCTQKQILESEKKLPEILKIDGEGDVQSELLQFYGCEPKPENFVWTNVHIVQADQMRKAQIVDYLTDENGSTKFILGKYVDSKSGEGFVTSIDTVTVSEDASSPWVMATPPSSLDQILPSQKNYVIDGKSYSLAWTSNIPPQLEQSPFDKITVPFERVLLAIESDPTGADIFLGKDYQDNTRMVGSILKRSIASLRVVISGYRDCSAKDAEYMPPSEAGGIWLMKCKMLPQ